MLKRNKIMFALLATTTLVSANTFAEESINGTASVTVQNAFDLVETTQLSFGVVTAVKASADPVTTSGSETYNPTITMNPDGTTDSADGDANLGTLNQITAGTPATFDVSNVASFTAMKITLPTTAVSLKASNGNTAAGEFSLSTFTLREVGKTANVTLTAGVGNITSDENGVISFNVGGQLAITGKDKEYTDGIYSGTYAVKVDY
jgi:hypothetical protein